MHTADMDEYDESGEVQSGTTPVVFPPLLTEPPAPSSSPVLFEIILAVSCVLILAIAMIFIWYKHRREKLIRSSPPERLITNCTFDGCPKDCTGHGFSNDAFGSSFDQYAGECSKS